MQTITFYAYKGGTGRTLALANAAVYLARLNQRVFTLDLDLESPGLHHKLGLSSAGALPPVHRGFVDCIHAFMRERNIPDTLAPYTIPIPREDERDGSITLMPAGNVLASHYWRQLSQLNWHELFYSEAAEGIPFFLELKERIKSEFSPDFLLIDARTGITEVGGVATTLLPDQVVCLLLNNRENLEGAREVLRGITRASVQRAKSIGIVPVLSRLPAFPRPPDPDREQRLLTEVTTFLTEPPSRNDAPLVLPPVYVLHTEESLAYQETLRIGGKRSVDESPLLRDYLHLFAHIIPSEQVEPHLDRLIEVAATKDKLLEDPDRVQADLEALTIYCPHPASYLALLKFYRLRNASPVTILRTAVRYWEVAHRPEHPVLQAVVREDFKPEQVRFTERIPHLGAFVRAVWEAAEDRDPTIGLRIVDQALMEGQRSTVFNVIRELLASQDSPEVVVACINRLVRAKDYQAARRLVQENATKLAEDAEFQVARASLVVATEDTAAARTLFGDSTLRPASILAKSPHVYLRLLRLAGRKEELEATLRTTLDRALASGDPEQLQSIGRLFAEVGQFDEFRLKISDTLPKHRARRILEMLARRGQSALFGPSEEEIEF